MTDILRSGLEEESNRMGEPLVSHFILQARFLAPWSVVLSLAFAPVLFVAALAALVAEPSPKPKMEVKVENFDSDPGWDGINNRIMPKKFPTITQDFGFSRTRFASKEKGELGGQVWRSTIPGYYGQKISPKSLSDTLNMSGTFALTSCSNSSGFFFGWFNAKQPGGGRPTNSLGWYLDGEKTGARLYFAAVTTTNRTQGKFVTPFEPRKGIKPTPIKADGTRHTFTLAYEPLAKSGDGRVRFTFDGGQPFVMDLPPGFKQEGAAFDRFGMMNTHKAGHPLTVFVGDLRRDNEILNLAEDPHWEGVSNRVTFQDRELTGTHNFGFSSTNLAGGKPGEVGGLFWRVRNPFAYYADRVGPLSFDDPLTASGRVAFTVGAPDSGMYLGWFSAPEEKSDAKQTNFVGIYLEGPSRVGHYFRPVYVTTAGSKGDARKGPVLVPDGKPHSWTMAYDPAGNSGNGALRVTLDKETVMLSFQGNHRREGASFNRFGLLTSRAGGGHVKVYFDDLSYTVARRVR